MKYLFYLLLLLPFTLFAQTNHRDTLNYSLVSYRYEASFNSIDSSKTKTLEINLDDFQNYLPFNHLGNVGQALAPIVYDKPSFKGFNYAINHHSGYYFTPENVKFYTARTPYSSLFYATGAKNEQVFKGTVSFNPKKRWNVSANFNRIRSDGFYARQNTNDNFINLTSNYSTRNNRYKLLLGFIYNGTKTLENGGLIPDTDTLNTSTGTRLVDADRRDFQRSIFVTQYINLGDRLGDSILGYQIVPKSRVKLSSKYVNNQANYYDGNPASGLYETIYTDSAQTFEKIINKSVENEVSWKRIARKQRGIKDMLGVELLAKHQYVTVRQNTIDAAFNNFSFGGGVYNTYSNHDFMWNVDYIQTLNGYNRGDYRISGNIVKSLDTNRKHIAIHAAIGSQSPDFIYNSYESNNFAWTNSFNSSNYSTVGIVYKGKANNFALGLDYSVENQALYFDTLAQAQQFEGKLNVLKAYVLKNITLGNWHLNNKITYQNISTSAVLRLPELFLEHSLYYGRPLFNNVMDFQTGVSLFYTSAYYASTYNPAMGTFYIQNATLLGGYPALNFFVNVQVKNTRVFIKVDHLNAGLMANEYQLSNEYPMNGRAFKFGLSWRFFD